MQDIIRSYKDELHLLEIQHKSRMEQGVKHINLDEYRIRIRMIRIFLDELETIASIMSAKDNEIEELKETMQRYRDILQAAPENTKKTRYTVKCNKCKDNAIEGSSYCKKHLQEEIKKAQKLVQQLDS